MKLLTDEKLIESIKEKTLLCPDYITESCNLYHLYFSSPSRSCSYDKASLIVMKGQK